MPGFGSQAAARFGESDDVASPVLVHVDHSQTLAERTEQLVAISQYENSGDDSVGDKLLREAQVLTWGVGGAFGDVVKNPISKLPEVATAGAFGAGVRVLERAGTKGKVAAGIVGVGMMAKMGFDEWRGERWSEFGSAMGASWNSKNNFYSSVEATKHSIGTLAVDMTVGSLAYKVAGIHDPMVSRSSNLSKSETGLVLSNPSRSLTNITSDFYVMGERSSLLPPRPQTPVSVIGRPAQIEDLALLERTTGLSDAAHGRSGLRVSQNSGVNVIEQSSPWLSNRTSSNPRASSNFETADRLVGGKRDLIVRHENMPVKNDIAKPMAPPEKAAPPTLTMYDDLHSKTPTGIENFGYLSAIREVGTTERTPGFKPTRRAYEEIAETLETMAQMAESDFIRDYNTVAKLVRLHAAKLD
ncbi:MAG: hypothetical protein SGJ27_30935 [Candidatus Melainabacteria bacterium]|nr:hypothetical protein [Candidatus Melainabacteria bacterium]